MNSRRSFFKKTFALAGTVTFSAAARQVRAESVSDALISLKHISPLEAAQDENTWERIAECFEVSRTMLNLNNAGISPQPKIVQDALDRYNRMRNELPSFYMNRVLDAGNE